MSTKIKKFAAKHGKKIGKAALTAATKTASTFSPLKKVKAAYKVGKAGVKLAKKADTALSKFMRLHNKTRKEKAKQMLKIGTGAGLAGTIAYTPSRKKIIKDFKEGHAANIKAAREFKRDLMLGKKGMDPERLKRQQANTKKIMSIRKKIKK